MLPVLTALDRYEKYAAWCRMLDIQPAEFDRWHREDMGISLAAVSERDRHQVEWAQAFR